MSHPPPVKPGPDPIGRGMKIVRRRLILNRLLSAVFFDLLIALSLFAVYLLGDRLISFPLDPLHVLIGLVAASLSISLIRAGIIGRFNSFQTATVVDERLGLKERVSSAVYSRGGFGDRKGTGVAGRPVPLPLEPWRVLVEQDGARVLAGVDLKRHFPIRLPRRSWLLVTALLAVALIPVAMPQFDLFGFRRAGEAEAKMRDEVKKEIHQLAKQIEEIKKENPKVEDPELKKILEELATQNPLDEKDPPQKNETPENPGDGAKKNALTQISRLEEAVKKQLEKAEFKDIKDFFNNFKPMATGALTKALQDALKEGKFDKARQELDKLDDDLRKLLEKQKKGELSKEEMARLEKLAEELARLAKNSANLSQLSKSLQGLSSNLSLSDLSQALDDLENAGTDLETLMQLMEQMDFLDQSLEMAQAAKGQLGKLHKCPNCGKLRKDDQPGGT